MRTLVCALFLMIVPDAVAWQVSDADCLDWADAYVENVRSFRQINLEYRVESGEVSSVEDGLSGSFDRRHEMKEMAVVLRVSGEKSLYRATAAGDQPIAGTATKNAGVVTAVVSLLDLDEMRVSDGKLSFSSFVKGAASIKDDGYGPIEGIGFSPFTMGIMTKKTTFPDELLRSAIAQDWRREFVKSEESVLTASLTFPGNESGRRLYFDKTRGFLPVRIETFRIDENGTHAPRDFAVIAKAIKCSDERWFPHTVVRFGPEQADGNREVIRIETTRLDADSPVTDQQLNLQLDVDTNVRLANGSIVLRKGTNVGPDDLVDLQMRANAAAEFER